MSGDSTVNRLLGKGNRQARGSVGSQSGPPPSSSMAATTSSGAGVASGAEESAAVVAGAASSPLSSPAQPTIASRAIAARAPHRRRIGTQAYAAVACADGGQQQPGDHRSAHRQPRHRHRQVRRLPHHGLVVAPGGEHPFGGRHREPGAAPPRRSSGQEGGDRGAPVRIRPGALLLGVRRRPRALQPRLGLRHLRGHREAAPPPRAGVRGGGHRHPPGRHRARELVVPDRGGRVPPAQGRPARGGSSSGGPSSPSCPWSSWRTSGP